MMVNKYNEIPGSIFQNLIKMPIMSSAWWEDVDAGSSKRVFKAVKSLQAKHQLKELSEVFIVIECQEWTSLGQLVIGQRCYCCGKLKISKILIWCNA